MKICSNMFIATNIDHHDFCPNTEQIHCQKPLFYLLSTYILHNLYMGNFIGYRSEIFYKCSRFNILPKFKD